jgi:hypothetical protein
MKRVLSCLLLASVVVARPGLAAESPFAGTWKLDPAKSEFTGDTFTIADAGGGKMKYTGGGMSYTFAADGKKQHVSLGYDFAWKKTGPSAWETTAYSNGKKVGTDLLELSEDGKTLKDTSTSSRPDGTKFEDVVVYERQGDGTGLVGKWKSTKAEVNGLRALTFTPHGKDGLKLLVADWGITTDAKLDGKDYPFRGPVLAAGRTIALKPAGDHKLEYVQKQKGKPVFRGSFAVSDDGKTLTWVQKPEGVDEPMTGVFTRE